MTTYNTKDPLGSASVKNLYDNSENLDKATNDREAEKWTDRFGSERLSWHGMEMRNERLIEKFNQDMLSAILAAGYSPVGSFQEGAEVNTRNETVLWALPEGDGDYYRWDGELQKQVAAGSTPQSTGGINKGAWVSVGDANLRSELNKTFKSAVNMGLIADGVTNEKGTLDSIKLTASEANAPVAVPATGNVRSRMHNEPVDDLMPEQFVTLGNLKGRLDVYDPEPVPSWNEAVDGVTGGTTTINANWLYAEFDKLVNASKGKLVRQEDIGTSQDGAYPIRQYLWVGANNPTGAPADRTLREVLVTAGIHGSETISMLGLLYFMKDLVEKGDEIPALRWLYYNTRIRIVPVANPWGVSQTPKVRNNSRGVNLNRNFDYLWDTLPTTNPGDADYKGDAPFSESETVALRSWFGQFSSRAVAYIDIHSMGIYTGNSAKAPHFVGFCSPLADPIANEIFTKFANKHTRIEILQNQNSPTSRAYATVRYGLPSITCEHTDTAWAREGASYSQAKDTSYSITGAVKMYGNVIAGFAKLAVRQLFPIHISDDNSDILVPSGINWIQLFPRNSYDAGIDGVIKIRACAVVKNTSDTATDVFLGVIGDGTAVDRKAVPYTTIQAQSTSALYVDNIFRVDKSQRKYPLSVHVASRTASVTVVRWYAIIEPQYLGYDVGNI
ncbi:M14 family zinc carboxypeptidase [Providencia sp. PROV236]|uniref:M14 family zinc carboxypeptidase n=1 Tax=Providencia sp. PROV236 TaxID=2936798 RepID=UPI0034E240EB